MEMDASAFNSAPKLYTPQSIVFANGHDFALAFGVVAPFPRPDGAMSFIPSTVCYMSPNQLRALSANLAQQVAAMDRAVEERRKAQAAQKEAK